MIPSAPQSHDQRDLVRKVRLALSRVITRDNISRDALAEAVQLLESALASRPDGEPRDHTCHWPGCTKQVPPAMWGCKAHWFALPKALRDKIWATYKPGQEITMMPSAAYLEAAHEVQAWIATRARKEG